MPKFDDASGVIASRFILFRLTESFIGREDKELTDKLLKELPGILNWAIAGVQMLKEDKEFIQPEEGADGIEQMAERASPVKAFIREKMDVREET
jgi:putative DNA primase/helicase